MGGRPEILMAYGLQDDSDSLFHDTGLDPW